MATSDRSDPRTISRSGRGRFTRNAQTAQRDADAARLRAEGKSYDQIATALGFRHRESARRAVERTLVEAVREPGDQVRQMELIRLDSLWMHAMGVLTANHVTVSNGKVVTIDGEPIPDDAPVLQAIDRLLKIMERRAKLLGLDAPAKVEVMSLDQIDAEIAKLERELGDATTGAAPVSAPPAAGED